MHGDRRENVNVPPGDGVARSSSICWKSFQHKWQVSLGLFFVMVGLVLFITMHYIIIIGLAVVCLGLFILIHAFCMVIKSSHVAVPGHFLLHPRTGTRYTHHQAIAVQRRLDRIRRATAENQTTVPMPPTPDLSPQNQISTPPPWQMEPPPSYETVMKTMTTVNQI